MQYAIGNPFHTLVGASRVGGSQEIIGGGAQEIIGALEQSNPALAEAVKTAVMTRNTWGVRDREFNKGRILLLGFQALAIANGAQVQVLTQPQYPFRPCRLIVPSTIAPGFRLNNITSGQQPIFAAAGGIPAEAFSEVATYVDVIWPTASIGNQVAIDVLNRSGAAADFEALMLGVTGVD